MRNDEAAINGKDVNVKILEDISDIGSGPLKRFSPSDTKVFSELEVNNAVQLILTQTDSLSQKHLSGMSDLEKLYQVQAFSVFMHGKIRGIGGLRGQMIIQLCSLFGLISLNYYTYLPMHMSGGGPETFLTSLMGYQKEDGKRLLQWNVNIVNEIQSLLNREFTFNMFENLSCEIGRSLTPHDVFFELPQLGYSSTQQQAIVSSKSSLQIVFRVDGNRNNEWNLQGYAGGKKKLIIFADDSKKHKKAPLLQWQRMKDSGLIPPSAKLTFDKTSSKAIIDLYQS